MRIVLKRVRLASGKFITRKVPLATEQELAKADPNEVWTSKEGAILVRDMETRHLINAMRILQERAAAHKAAIAPQADSATVAAQLFPVYSAMRRELERRFKPASTAQPIRKIDLTP